MLKALHGCCRGLILALGIVTFSLPAYAVTVHPDCPPGSVEVLDAVIGPVCRNYQTGAKLLPADEQGNCPLGFRVMPSQAGLPYCTSSIAGAPNLPMKQGIAAGQTNICGKGEAPVIDTSGEKLCRRSPQMDQQAFFKTAGDCPFGSVYGVRNGMAACLER